MREYGSQYKLIGKNYRTADLLAKVTGKAKYAEDYRAEGMLFCKLLLSPLPHARVKHIDARAVKEKLSNVHTILGNEDDPLLPRNTIDAVLILKTYHEIAQPILLLAHLREAMRPDALLGIIDKNGNGKDHGINREVVIKEAAEAGFSLVDQYDFVKPDGMDYFLVFRVGVAIQSH